MSNKTIQQTRTENKRTIREVVSDGLTGLVAGAGVGATIAGVYCGLVGQVINFGAETNYILATGASVGSLFGTLLGSYCGTEFRKYFRGQFFE